MLVANRGEIAVRVIRTCHEMGIPAVAVYSTIDANALHVKLADEAVCIGEAPSKDSYLNIPNIVAAAMSHNCTMLHPGYGFLAENATFADICLDHGLNFIGPKVSNARGCMGHCCRGPPAATLETRLRFAWFYRQALFACVP